MKTWKPLGRDRSYILSDWDNQRRDFFLGSCVSELTARFSPPPGEVLRAAQIVECMATRDWHLVVDDTEYAQARRDDSRPRPVSTFP
jgi:hypothetical protein